MARRILSALCLLLAAFSVRAQTAFETATQAVANMKVGWNLGNTLDSHSGSVSDPTATETLRGQSVTKPELMAMMKEAGFGAVRVPVTWYPHMASDGTVAAAWMARVKEVVDYVIGQGLYCIINVHHDGLYSGTTFPGNPWLKATMANYTANHALYENLWTQIANTFRDYGEKLIFEGYNELLDSYSSWNYASYACEDRYDAAVAADAYEAVNSYAQSFVNAVRATGGNNLQRNLVVKTYGSCGARGTWSTHVTDPLTEMDLPADVSEHHIIFGVHAYPRIAESDGTARPWTQSAAELDAQFSNLTTILAAKGAPVIITEWGSSNVNASVTDYDAIRDHFLYFAGDFVSRCKSAGIAPFYWMGISDKTDRTTPAMTQADLAHTIIDSYYEGSYEPYLPLPSDFSSNYAITYTGQYGEVSLLSNTGTTKYDQVRITLQSGPGTGNLQFKKYLTSGTTQNVTIAGTSTAETLTIDAATVKQVTLQWRTATFNPVTITSLKLRQTDGTVVDALPTAMHKCSIETLSSPEFAKLKVSAALYTSLYYSDTNFIVPSRINAKAYKLEDGRLVCVKTYEEGDVIPMGTGVVLCGEAQGYYIFRNTDASGEAPVGSMLRGSDVAATTTGGDTYYMLSLNSSSEISSAGFYYVYADGGPFTSGAHKAYLAVPAGQHLTSRYFFSDVQEADHDVATSLGYLRIAASDAWYTLDGRRLDAPPAAPGIYLRAGKKVVVK